MITNIFCANKPNILFCHSFTSTNASNQNALKIKQEENRLVEYYFKSLPTTEKMANEDCEILKKSIQKSDDMKEFIMVSLGVKPAAIISVDKRCCLDGMKSENFDVLETNDRYNNVIVFNKKESLKNIETNKKFITQKMNIPKTVDNELIYSILTDKKSPINSTNPDYENNHDLLGVVLGFPLTESVLFQLDNMTGLNSTERQDIPLLKSEMKKVFNTTNLYDNFDSEFKTDMIKNINSINQRKFSDEEDMTYVRYFSERDNNKDERLSKYLKELEKVNELGYQRSLNSINTVGNIAISDDYYNYLMMTGSD